jgi:hypothetical protein
MQRLLLLTLVLVATFAAGCGSSSSSSSNGSSTPATTSSTATTSAKTTSSGASAPESSITRLILRACKSRIQAAPALTSAEKATIEKLCTKEAVGGSAARKANVQICQEIVQRSALQGSPNTPAREQALAACKSGK